MPDESLESQRSTTHRPGSARTGHPTPVELGGAALGGFLGSILLGVLMQFGSTLPMLDYIIPGMYGIDGPAPLAGWALHQFHGVALAVGYVLVVHYTSLAPSARTIRGAVGLGVAYGIVTTIVLSVLVMPLWLSVVGYPDPLSFPNITAETPGSFFGHIVYALPVAVGYALVATD